MKGAAKKQHSRRIEGAGWTFWCVAFGIALGPSILLFWRFTYGSVSRMAPFSFGLILAALVAGMITWGTNAAIQSRIEKQRKADRKRARKKK